MPRLTLSFLVCCPYALMACHADVIRPCVLPKGDAGMPLLTSFDRVCCPKAVMSCHTRRSPTVCDAQGR